MPLRKLGQTLDHMLKPFSFFLLCCILLVGCEAKNQSSTNSGNKAPEISAPTPKEEKPLTFARFQEFFLDDTSMENWPEETLEPLILSGDEIFSEKGIDDLLKVTFTEIPSEYYSYIPIEKLKQLRPNEVETKDVRSAFRFYGFKQILHEKYIVMSFFSYKLRKDNNEEYHAHPFVIATFTPDGKPIDQYVWWTIENDVYQVWDDVDIDGEELLKGRKEDPNDSELNEVYEKVGIQGNGMFKEIYKDWPKASGL